MAKARRELTATPTSEMTANVRVDVDSIPVHVRDDLAAATLELIRGILRQPDGRERLDAKIAARKAAAP